MGSRSEPGTAGLFVRGGLSGVSGYGVDEAGELLNATALSDATVPAAGFYYLVRLGGTCSAGSWQSVVGAEPGRRRGAAVAGSCPPDSCMGTVQMNAARRST